MRNSISTFRPGRARCAAVATGMLVCAGLAATGPVAAEAAAVSAPLLSAPASQTIAGSYIVVLKGAPAATGASAAADFEAAVAAAKALGAQVTHRYTSAVNGFATTLTAAQLAEVRKLPGVDYVSPDRVVEAPTTQSPADWGLDRIDQRNLPLSNSYTYGNDGTGVTLFALDTGVRSTHTELAGRLLPGVNVTTDGLPSTDTNDCSGHGTGMAGIFNGLTYGVAKGAELVPVRVFNCGATSGSNVIAGIDWVNAHKNDYSGPKLVLIEAVVHSIDPVFTSAVQNAIDGGLTYIIPAGNYQADACGVSPAAVTDGIVVGGSNSSDQRADWFSDYGPCVDLFAPGDGVTTASFASDTATGLTYGTSPAAPYVAGVAATYLQSNPTATPAQVHAAIIGAATTGVLDVKDSTGSTPNRLLYNSFTAPPAPTFAAQHANLAPGAPNDNAIMADLRVRAPAGAALDLSQVTLRYWFTRDSGASTYSVACDYAALGCANVTRSVVNLAPARPGADAYLQVGFTSGAGSVAAGTTTGTMQLRWNKTDWSNFAEANDHSYRASSTLSDNVKVTGYYNGVLVWGTEP